jgi:2-polyprenyl-3-methyl-5-hydroxy-6-metoxy-1,4-benzoquinol methylase
LSYPKQVQSYYDLSANPDESYFDWKIAHYRANKVISRSFEWLKWEGKDVLDIGCGAGYYSIPLSYRCNEIVGIDLSPENIRIAKHHAKRLQVHNAEFSQANLFDFAPPHPFDVVYMITVLMHIPDLEKALAKIHSFLKPSGYLLISDLNRYFHRRYVSFHRQQPAILMQTFTFKELRALLENTGFEVIRESGRLFSFAGLRKPDWMVSLKLERWAEKWPLKYMGEHVALLARRI